MTDAGHKVPENPIIPYIEGDGMGPDTWAAAVRVFDAAAAKAYGGSRKIEWKEVVAGEKAFKTAGSRLPPETEEAFKEYLIGIKGPLTTPVGEGFRSLNVTLRQRLDLYVCLRPVKYYQGIPSPVKKPEQVDSVILSGMMMFEYLGRQEAADLIDRGLVGAISKKQATYDFARLMEGSVQVSTSKFADTIIENMRK